MVLKKSVPNDFLLETVLTLFDGNVDESRSRVHAPISSYEWNDEIYYNSRNKNRSENRIGLTSMKQQKYMRTKR